MNKLIPLLLVACLLACALAFLALSTAVRQTAPAVVEQAPALIREFRYTDTLDELQQLHELERPLRPVWPLILFLIIPLLLFGMVVGTPFLKQANSLLRQVKRRRGGHGRRVPPPHWAPSSAARAAPCSLTATRNPTSWSPGPAAAARPAAA